MAHAHNQFVNFLNKLTTPKNAALMEAVKKGYKICCESSVMDKIHEQQQRVMRNALTGTYITLVTVDKMELTPPPEDDNYDPEYEPDFESYVEIVSSVGNPEWLKSNSKLTDYITDENSPVFGDSNYQYTVERIAPVYKLTDEGVGELDDYLENRWQYNSDKKVRDLFNMLTSENYTYMLEKFAD